MTILWSKRLKYNIKCVFIITFLIIAALQPLHSHHQSQTIKKNKEKNLVQSALIKRKWEHFSEQSKNTDLQHLINAKVQW